MLSLLKLLGAPGSIPLFALLTALSLVLVLRGRRRAGVRLMLAACAAYLLLALPAVANAIAGALPAGSEVASPASAAPDVLVIFDGDNRRGRVRTALLELERRPDLVAYALGDDWMVEEFAKHGIGPEQAYLVYTSNTREQIAWTAGLERRHPSASLAIVASRLQMPRVRALVAADGIRARLIASPVDDEPATTGMARFIPRYIALRVSRDAIYEHAALVYYHWRGWI